MSRSVSPVRRATLMIMIVPLLLLVAAAALAPPELDPSAITIRYRLGEKSDEFPIALTLARELMNPLGVRGRRFVVAEADGERIGWAQLRPVGPALSDPSRFDSQKGSGSIEDLVDDEIWDAFDDDEVKVPVGLASLPWTKEYRSFADAAVMRREKRIASIERERNLAPQLWELASVYVVPPYRGRGVGGELVRRTMDAHVAKGRPASDVYLLTLATTIDWYRRFGFEVTNDAPAPMQFEVAAGKVVTKAIGAELVCMRGGVGS